MALSCGQKFLQIMLIIWNVILLLYAIGVIVVASVYLHSLGKYGFHEKHYLGGFSIFVIVLGCYLLVVGIFGFCGAITENICCLTTYCILVAIFILAGIAGAIAGFVLRNKVKNGVETGMDELYETYRDDKKARKIVDGIQKDLKCCGPKGTWPTSQGDTPSSCNDENGIQYSDGCNDKVHELFRKYMLAIGICLILFALVLIIGIAFTVCVIDAIKNDARA